MDCVYAFPRSSLELLEQRIDNRHTIANDSVVGSTEDRSFTVAVDGDDQASILHAAQMVSSTGDTEANVDFRTDALTGSTDHLAVIRNPTFVDNRSGAASGTTHLGSQLFELVPVLLGTNTEAAADDEVSLLDRNAFGLFLDNFDRLDLALGVVNNSRINSDDFTFLSFQSFSREQAGLDGCDLRSCVRDQDLADDLAAECRNVCDEFAVPTQ